MKKITLLFTTLCFALVSFSQNYGDIQGQLLIGNVKKAKADLDKRMTNEKFAAKAEAYILKATVYSYAAADSTISPAEKLLLTQEADQAFTKYKQMEPGYAALNETVYKDAPAYIYSNYFNEGLSLIEQKNWKEAHEMFQKVYGYSNFLKERKTLNSPLDTVVVLYTGYTAEQSGDKGKAAQYYKELADAKVQSSYESVYNFLVIYYFEQKDMDNFEKYRKLGLELFPQSDFFKNEQADFALGLDNSFDSKLKSLEEVLQKNPNDFKAQLALGRTIFDTLYSIAEGAVPPANATELERKMIAAFTKASSLDSENDLVLLYMGDHYIQQANKVNDDISSLENEINKKGGKAKASKDDNAKLATLEKNLDDLYENTRVPYEKAAGLYAKKGQLNATEKQQYRNIAGFLGDIYTRKREKAEKAKAPNLKQLQADEEKWNDLYMQLGRRN